MVAVRRSLDWLQYRIWIDWTQFVLNLIELEQACYVQIPPGKVNGSYVETIISNGRWREITSHVDIPLLLV